MPLWELQAQAVTGWNLDVRRMSTKSTMEKVTLSRMVLEGICRVTEKDRADEQGVSVEELQEMKPGPVLMTQGIAQKVWQNVNKLGGLKQTGGI